MEVEHDVDEEDHINHTVEHQDWNAVHCLALKGGIVGYHDSGVEGENENGPVPDALEEGVVQQDVGWRARNFLTVPWNAVVVGKQGVLRALWRWQVVFSEY